MSSAPPSRARSVSATFSLWCPRAVSLVVLALYAVLAPPSYYWLDSAELSAAGLGLGSSHPTGFPLYIVMVKLAGLVPVGELAFRVNLLSAGCAALAVLWLGRLVQHASTGGERSAVPASTTIAAGAAALGLGASLMMMRHGTVAEVYTPTAAILIGSLLLLLRVSRGGRARDGLLLALVAGLGLGLHTGYRPMLAVVFVLVLWRLYRGARWPLYTPLLLFGSAVATYIYLPVRSATGRIAAIDWGHPHTFSAFRDHISAARIRDAFDEQILSDNWIVVKDNAAAFFAQLADSVGPVAILGAATGVVVLATSPRRRWLLAALLVVVVVDCVYSFWINPMGTVDLQNGLLAASAIAALAGVGVAALVVRAGRAAAYVAAVVAVLWLVPVGAVSLGSMWPGRSSDTAHALAESALAEAPPRSLMLSQSDSLSSGLLFAQTVEGARPDVAALVRQHLADDDRTESVIEAAWRVDIDYDRSVPLASLLASGRPVRWELGTDGTPPGFRVEVGAATAELSRGAPSTGTADIARAAAGVRRLFGKRADDAAGELMYATRLVNLGRVAFGRGDLQLASALFTGAVVVRPRHAAAWVNLGVVAAISGDFAKAAQLCERALSIEPLRVRALINAARYYHELEDTDRALQYVGRVLEIEPDHEVARGLQAAWQ